MNRKQKEAYTKTLEAFNYECAICGNNEVQIHHILYGKLYGTRDNLTYFGNLIPLCKKHHDLVHTDKNKYIPILQKIIKEVVDG